MKDFKICKKCDFEWHLNDGVCCPVCNQTEKVSKYKGGVFGTGQDAQRWKNWFRCLGLIALVYFIYQIIYDKYKLIDKYNSIDKCSSGSKQNRVSFLKGSSWGCYEKTKF